jgi:hypothetical protein
MEFDLKSFDLGSVDPKKLSAWISDFSPKDTFCPVGTLAMPSKELVVDVGQNQIGYLTLDMPQKYILTYGLGPCIGLYVRNQKTGAQTLAHIADNQASKARAFGTFIRQRRLIDTEKEGEYLRNNSLIQILQSTLASDKDVKEVTSALKGWGYHNVEVLRKFLDIKGDNSIDVIYDSEGKMHKLTDIQSTDELTHLRMPSVAFSDSLHVTNENRIALNDPLRDLAERYELRKKTKIF